MELVTILTGGGPYVLAAAFAYLYMLERTERREVQKERNELLEKALEAISGSKEAMRELRSVITGGKT